MLAGDQVNRNVNNSTLTKRISVWLSCPSLVSIGCDGNLSTKRKTQATDFDQKDDQWCSIIKKKHVCIDIHNLSEDFQPSDKFKMPKVTIGCQENEPLVSEITRIQKPRIKKKTKKLGSGQWKVIGVIAGLGVLSWPLAHNIKSPSTTEKPLTSITVDHPDSTNDQIALIERKVNESFYRYRFA